MRVMLYTPWENRWKESTKKAFENAGHEAEWVNVGIDDKPVDGYDRYVSMWLDDRVAYLQKRIGGKPLFCYIRSYEVYNPIPKGVDVSKLAALLFCSPEVQSLANYHYGRIVQEKQQHVILNWLDVSEWKFNERNNKGDIGIAASINYKKNYSLALQLIGLINDGRKLRVAGKMEDTILAEYLENMFYNPIFSNKLKFYGDIKPGAMPEFYDRLSFIVSPSLKEGCPMNVLEAMACGVKPIIHSWPGARRIFPNKYIWDLLPEAVDMIYSDDYNSYEYRDYVIKNHGLDNADRLVKIVTES